MIQRREVRDDIVNIGGKAVMLQSILFAIVGVIGFTMPVAAEDVRAAIDQANARFVEAFKAGDAAAIAGFYTENAKMLPPDASEVAGREAIQKFWQSWIDDGLKNLTLEASDVEADGDLAYEIGEFSIQAPAANDAMATATGNYLVVWKRGSGGDWQLHVDTWNDAPAQ
jgi:uncharacterized protein (TIGR02246 family)